MENSDKNKNTRDPGLLLPRKSTRSKSGKNLKRWLALPVGAVIFVIGLVIFPLPIPFGLILMIVGLCVAAFNPLVARIIKRRRRRYPHLNARLRKIAPHLPAFMRRFLSRTDSPS